MSTLRQNVALVRERIAGACARAGRDPSSVQLLAVTKLRTPGELVELEQLGLRAFGENRVQALRERAEAFPGIEWHMIGQLQTNKAKYLPPITSWIHSVDRGELAVALDKAYGKAGGVVNVLMEVSISGEESKSGVSPARAAELGATILALPNLRLQGLMTMAPFTEDSRTVREIFRGLASLAEGLRRSLGEPLPHLSMGMSNDFEIAIEEGATIVRIGGALFEARE